MVLKNKGINIILYTDTFFLFFINENFITVSLKQLSCK